MKPVDLICKQAVRLSERRPMHGVAVNIAALKPDHTFAYAGLAVWNEKDHRFVDLYWREIQALRNAVDSLTFILPSTVTVKDRAPEGSTKDLNTVIAGAAAIGKLRHELDLIFVDASDSLVEWGSGKTKHTQARAFEGLGRMFHIAEKKAVIAREIIVQADYAGISEDHPYRTQANGIIKDFERIRDLLDQNVLPLDLMDRLSTEHAESSIFP